MIPGVSNLKEVEITTIPSKDYRMDISGERIVGICEGLEEIKQTIFCILNTERYQYPIYSWNYGIELNDLYGKSTDYVMSELKRRITEALIQDDRIESVDEFEFEVSGMSVLITFTVHTVFGDVPAEKRWN